VGSDRTSEPGTYGRSLASRTGRRPLLRAAILTGLGVTGSALLAACGASGAKPTPSGGGGTASPNATPAGPAGAQAAINTRSLTGSGSGGILRIGMSAANVPIPNTPPTEGGEGARFVGTQIYEGLTRLNTDQADKFPTPQPGMAESWTIGEDKLTWTFKLR
jgi:ABC-type transport system substrate-binding protein